MKIFGKKNSFIFKTLFFSLIDNESPKKRKAGEELDWIDYHSLAHIYEWLDKIKLEFPQDITVEDIGTTYEGRPLKLVKLSKRAVINFEISV